MFSRIDIDIAAQACSDHPVLGPATRFLKALKDATDDQSDGWTSWPKPARAAKRLQELIRKNVGGVIRPSICANLTLEDVEKTLTPIKAMVTNVNKKYKFEFNVEAEWEKAKR